MKRMTAVVTLCLAPLVAGHATAQQTTTTTATPVAGRAPLGVTVIEMETVVLGWSAKRALIDKAVVNDKKERIGKVEDLIITPSKDAKAPHASFAIIGVGGFLGIGTKDVVIPLEQIKMQDGKLVLAGATKDALKALPEFKYQKR
jgi:sporulation protein YlmC with PRC-barrel domain